MPMPENGLVPFAAKSHRCLCFIQQNREISRYNQIRKLSPGAMIHNGNCTEWSAIWAEIIRVISKSNERSARVRYEITSMISDQNCTTRGSITTLLHPFWNRPNTGLGQFKCFIDAVLSRSEIKFMSIFWGEKVRVEKQKLQNLPHDTLCLSFYCYLIGYFKNLIGCSVFNVASSLAGKRCDLKQKMGRFVNKSHQLEPIRLQGPPVISKWL